VHPTRCAPTALASPHSPQGGSFGAGDAYVSRRHTIDTMHPKVQHYVPQFYLRSFANRRRKQYFIYCFDKTTRRIFQPNIRNIASEKRYYDFSTEDGEAMSIEGYLSDLETHSQKALEAIIQNPSAKTMGENKKALANFIAFQESRTSVFRTEHINMIKGINRKFGSQGGIFPEPGEDEIKRFQAAFLLENTPLFAQIMLEMKWVLVLNQTNKSFWTSDNPIIRYNPHQAEFVGNLGLTSSGIQLHIPLSPSLGLILCDPQEYADLRLEAFAIPANVDFNNSGQVIHSRQYLFSVDANFQLAKIVLNRNPEYGDPDRQRMIAS
jgi:hypothetical protein